MNLKRILLVLIALMIVFSSLSLISAEESQTNNSKTKFLIGHEYNVDNGLYINLRVYSSLGDCSNKPIQVNLTDSKGHTETYDLTTVKTMVDEGEVNITHLKNDTYEVYIHFPGDRTTPEAYQNYTISFKNQNTSSGDSSNMHNAVDAAHRLINERNK